MFPARANASTQIRCSLFVINLSTGKNTMSSNKKSLFSPSRLALLAAVAGLGTFTIQLYRRPLETFASVSRAAMLLAGAHEGTCEVAGLPIHYYHAGRGEKPLIFVHGLGGSAENWLFLFPRLSKEYHVYALDLPGFGRTPLAPEGTNIRTHALYLQRFLDAMGLSQVTLVGNSLGGWIATRFVLDAPERVSHLYLLNSAGLSRKGAFTPYTPDYASARRAIAHFSGRPIPARVPNFLLKGMVESSRRPAFAGFVEHYDKREELDNELSHVSVPTTIIWGTEDRILPLSCAHDFHAGIPNSELILLPGVGHTPQTGAVSKVANIILQDVPSRKEFQ
jgi:pimeloyl-ACP methyl ester carboxylesterase